MGIKQVSQLALGVSGLLGVLAACSDSADQTSVSVSDSTSKANVSIGVYNAQGKQTASCAGTLIGPTTVLTAGHCVTGGAKWQVTAPQVSGDAVTGYRAVSYDWQNFQSTLSHRFHVDIGVVILEKPIALDHYPTLSSTPIDGSEALVRVRRTDTSSPRTTFEGVSGDVSLGTSKGFAFDYLGSVGGGETIDTGGALIDTRTNIIYGVVSGKGDQTGMMHVARIDVMGKWLSSKLQCHNNRPVAMTTQCHPGSSSGGTTGSSSGSSGASCGSSGGTSSSGGSSGSSGTNGSSGNGGSSGSTSSSGGSSSGGDCEGGSPGTPGTGGSSSGGASSSGGGSSSGFGASSGGGSSSGFGTSGGTAGGGSVPPSGGASGAVPPNGSSGSGGSVSGGPVPPTGGNGVCWGNCPSYTVSNLPPAGGTATGGTVPPVGGGAQNTTVVSGDGPGCAGPTCGGCVDLNTCGDDTIDFGGNGTTPGTGGYTQPPVK